MYQDFSDLTFHGSPAAKVLRQRRLPDGASEAAHQEPHAAPVRGAPHGRRHPHRGHRAPAQDLHHTAAQARPLRHVLGSPEGN